MNSIVKSLNWQPNDKTGSPQILLNFHAACKLKEDNKKKICGQASAQADCADKKETIEGGTHPTIGIETISEVNLDQAQDKTEVSPIKEVNNKPALLIPYSTILFKNLASNNKMTPIAK